MSIHRVHVRSPLRLSLFGGGSDLPEWFSENSGSFVSQAIDLFVRVTVTTSLDGSFSYNGQDVWNSQTSGSIPYVAATLRAVESRFGEVPPVGIVSDSDVAPGSGLGSSGSWLVGMVRALATYIGKAPSDLEVALCAYEIERSRLSRTVGMQDQIAAAFGGSVWCQISKSGQLRLSQPVTPAAQMKLVSKVILVPTGITRSASGQLRRDLTRLQSPKADDDPRVTKNYLLDVDRIASLVKKIGAENGRAQATTMMNEWVLQSSHKLAPYKERHPDLWEHFRMLERSSGAAVKLVGAGGGGYFALLFPSEEAKDEFAGKTDESTVDVRAALEGARVVQSDRK